jgi:hypothetical protein
MRPLQDAFAVRSKSVETLAALDDRDPEFLFELTNAPRERRLRDVAGLCRSREVLLACERDEILQLSDIHSNYGVRPIATMWKVDHLLPLTIVSARAGHAIDGGLQSCAR